VLVVYSILCSSLTAQKVSVHFFVL